MLSLGKFLTTFIFLFAFSYAEVTVSLSSNIVSKGDQVKLTVTALGGELEMPSITSIGPYPIEGVPMKNRSITIVNGQFSAKESFTYSFTPSKSFTIPEYEVVVDGKIERTKVIKLSVEEPKNRELSKYYIELESSSKSLYVGEPFSVTVSYYEHHNADVVEKQYSAPGRDDMWVKKLSDAKQSRTSQYGIIQLKYIYAAQKSGEITIAPAKMKVGIRNYKSDSWGFPTFLANWKTLYSKPIKIDVKPLPKGVNLVGDLRLEVGVDKREVDANEAVNLSIKIEGEGNFEDIEPFEFNIDNVMSYNEKPTVLHNIENDGSYSGAFEQKIALIATDDFTVKPIKLRYFNKKRGKIVELFSEPIEIRVRQTINAPLSNTIIQKAPSKTETKTEDSSSERELLTLLQAAALLVFGILVGAVLKLVPYKRLFSKKKSKRALSDKKEILALLLRHTQRGADIKQMAEKLAENIYEGKSHHIDAKELKKILEELNT